MAELRESTKRLFQQSQNPHLRELGGGRPQAPATYDQDNIFLGWNLGGKQEYEQLKDHYELELLKQGETNIRKLKNNAILLALRAFPSVVGERKGQLFVDRSEPDLMFIGGYRGAGKSYNMRGYSNRSDRAGVTQVLLDPEHEYVSNNFRQGIQSKYENLRDRERPSCIDTAVLMPYFVWKARRDRDVSKVGEEYTMKFQFQFSDLTPSDIEYLFLSHFDHNDYRLLTMELTSKLKSGHHSIDTWQDVIAVAREMDAEDKFNWKDGGRVREIKTFIEGTYERYKFLGDEYPIKGEHPDTGEEFNGLEELLELYDTVALSLHDSDGLPEGLAMKELYVCIFIKKLRNLIEQGKITGSLDLIIDEAHEYYNAADQEDPPPAAKQIKQVIKNDRKRGFRVTLGTQAPGDIPEENGMDQVRYILIPQNMKKGPRRTLLEAGEVTDPNDRQRGKWETIFEAMDQHQWLLIDSETNEWWILEPASPLAFHLDKEWKTGGGTA